MGMFGGLSGDLGTLALGLVIAGVVSGLVAGMLGMGGGIVIVPVLYHVLGAAGVPDELRMHVAIGTSLAALVPTTLTSLSTHAKNNAVDWPLVKRWAGPALLGVGAGSALAAFASAQMLALFFGAVALPVAGYLGFGKESWRLATAPPRGIGGGAIAFGIGGVSAMMGVSGGLKSVVAMNLCGMPDSRAVGTASAIGAIITISAAVGAVIAGWGVPDLPRFSYGYVNLLAFAVIAPVTFVTTPIAARFPHLADLRRLRRTFALFVAITALKLLWDALT